MMARKILDEATYSYVGGVKGTDCMLHVNPQ